MTIVIHGAAVATVDANDTVIYDGAVAVEADRIAAVGPSHDVLARYPVAEKIDGTGKAVMPGFANIHTHLHMTLARGVYRGFVAATQAAVHQRPGAAAAAGSRSGGTCHLVSAGRARGASAAAPPRILEDATGIESYAEDLAATGLRFLLTERAWDKAKGSIGDPAPFELDRKLGERCLQRIEALARQVARRAEGRITVGVSAWAPDMCSPDLLRDVRALQQKLDTVATIHLNQIWGEVAAVKARARLHADRISRRDRLSQRSPDLRALPMHGAAGGKAARPGRGTVAFNSAIAARRGLSPRIADLEQYGCNIAMGTDNMAEDMVEVMRTGMFMERVRREDGRQPTPEQATALGDASTAIARWEFPMAAALIAGNKADLIMIDLARAHLVPVLRVVSDFVHKARARRDGVMVDGRWIMRDGKVLTMDEARIVAEAQRLGKIAWRRLFDSRPDLPVPAGFAPADLPRSVQGKARSASLASSAPALTPIRCCVHTRKDGPWRGVRRLRAAIAIEPGGFNAQGRQLRLLPTICHCGLGGAFAGCPFVRGRSGAKENHPLGADRQPELARSDLDHGLHHPQPRLHGVGHAVRARREQQAAAADGRHLDGERRQAHLHLHAARRPQMARR